MTTETVENKGDPASEAASAEGGGTGTPQGPPSPQMIAAEAAWRRGDYATLRGALAVAPPGGEADAEIRRRIEPALGMEPTLLITFGAALLLWIWAAVTAI